MSTAINNLTMYVGTLPVKVRSREKGVPKEEQKLIEKEHMNGNCNTILRAFIEMNMNGKKAQPSVKYLASLIGGSVRTVIRCLDTLQLSGLIEKKRRGCGWTNIYKISLRLWKRLFVGLKKAYGAVEKIVEEVQEVIKEVVKEVPRPTFPLIKASGVGIMEAIQMLEDDYEEATKPI